MRYPRRGNAWVVAAVDFAPTANLFSFVRSRMHFSILYQTKPLRAHSHFPLSQLQMSPLACLQWALCCLPVMACEISIIIIMAPRAAMSANGRSLIGNELSHHPKGTCLLLLLFGSMQCGSLTDMFLCIKMKQIWRNRGSKRWCLALSNIIILLPRLLLQITEVKQEFGEHQMPFLL